MGTNSGVDECSGAYSAGEWSGYAWEVGMMGAGAGAAAKASGWSGKVALHGAHHSFGKFGKLYHIQGMIWKKGVKNSHRIGRIPLSWC